MDMLTTTLRVVVSLGVVLAAIWFLSKRFRGGSPRAAKKTSTVSVLGKANVAAKASVVVVETEGRRLVLGVTEHGVSVLHSSDAPPEPAFDEVLAAQAASPAAQDTPREAPAAAPPASLAAIADANSAGLSPQFRTVRPSFGAALLGQLKKALTGK